MNSPTNNPSFDLPGDFYRLLCQEAAVAMIATDADFNIKYWNQAAVALVAREDVPVESMGAHRGRGRPYPAETPQEVPVTGRVLVSLSLGRGLHPVFHLRRHPTILFFQ